MNMFVKLLNYLFTRCDDLVEMHGAEKIEGKRLRQGTCADPSGTLSLNKVADFQLFLGFLHRTCIGIFRVN
jgi:hypothetical protein